MPAATRKLAALLCLLLTLLVTGAGQSPAGSQAAPASRSASPAASADDDLLKLESDWLAAEARNDSATLDKMIHPDFLGMNMSGGIVTKDDIVPRDGAEPGPFSTATLDETTDKIVGDTGIVLGTLRMKGPPAGRMKFSMVWKRTPEWRMIAAHLGPVLHD